MNPDPIDPGTLAPELARAATVRELQRIRSMLLILVLIGITIALFFARDVILPLILGVMLALTLSPVVRVTSRIGIPAPLSAIVLILGMAIGLGAGGYGLSGPVSTWIESAPQMGVRLEEKLRGVIESVDKVTEAADQAEEIAQGDTSVQRVAVEQPGLLNSAASAAATTGATIAVALVLALFILASGEMFYVKLVDSYPKLSDKKRALRIVYGVERAISRYLLTITVINASLGLVVFALMWSIGLPNAYVWGLVAFLFNFLPFIGSVAGAILVGLYAILMIDPLGAALLAPALYLAATTVEGNIVTPAVLGRSLQLNTVSVFVTVVFWGWIWGVPGALMAVPFLVIVKVVCDNVPALKTLGRFLGSADTSVEKAGAAQA